jgi:RNase P/RNase MRP subunit POP5
MVKVGRGKRRYLLFHLTVEGDFRPKAEEVWKAVYEAYRRLFGLAGLSQAELAWIDYRGNSGFGILRCSHKAVARLRTALAIIGRLNGRRARICTVRVSGTIKTLKEALRRMEGK